MNKTIKSIVLAVLCLFNSYIVSAQAIPLSIGDAFPNMKFERVLNYKSESISTIKLENKLIVLAFWSSTCRNTRESLRKLSEVQDILGDKIQIIAVTDQSADAIKKDPIAYGLLKSGAVPLITSDTLLKATFPSNVLPHLVWIYKDKVHAITGAEYLKASNVHALLKGEKSNWPVKKDIVDFDYSKPLLTVSSNSVPAVEQKYYSQLTAHLPGILARSGIERDSVNKTVRTWIINMPVYQMYLTAFRRVIGVLPTQHLWDVESKGKYIYDEREGYKAVWDRQNTFCYESVLPIDISDKERRERIRTDLNTFLNLDCSLQRRTVDVLLLEFLPEKLPVSAGGKSVNTLHRSDTVRVMRNVILSGLAWEMNKFDQNPPVLFDKTNNPRIDLDFGTVSMSDIDAIRKVLKPHGVFLTPAKREVELFIFSEKQPKKQSGNLNPESL